MQQVDKMRNMTAIYISRNGKMLLLYRVGSRVVAPSWCGVGGHFEKDELNDAKAAVLREMNEEIGLIENDLLNFKMRYITLRNKNGEIRQNYYFFADLKSDVQMELISNEGELKWFELYELSELKMPFSAKYMMEHYLSVGMHDDKVYGGVADGTGVVFTELVEF